MYKGQRGSVEAIGAKGSPKGSYDEAVPRVHCTMHHELVGVIKGMSI